MYLFKNGDPKHLSYQLISIKLSQAWDHWRTYQPFLHLLHPTAAQPVNSSFYPGLSPCTCNFLPATRSTIIWFTADQDLYFPLCNLKSNRKQMWACISSLQELFPTWETPCLELPRRLRWWFHSGTGWVPGCFWVQEKQTTWASSTRPARSWHGDLQISLLCRFHYRI